MSAASPAGHPSPPAHPERSAGGARAESKEVRAESKDAAAKKGDPRVIVNLPNALTVLRLLLCFAFFGILIFANGRLLLPIDGDGALAWRGWPAALRAVHAELHASGPEQGLALLFDIAFAIFLLAAITDTLDGQIARRWGLETDFGRIADPFVDKIMIIGALVLLMPLTVYIAGWMVVLVLARELLVSGIRGFAESRGVAFKTSFWGKTKMVSQTAFVGAAILYVGHPDVAWWRTFLYLPLLWLAIGTTVLSGLVYLAGARRVLRLAGAAGGHA